MLLCWPFLNHIKRNKSKKLLNLIYNTQYKEIKNIIFIIYYLEMNTTLISDIDYRQKGKHDEW